MHHFLLTVTEIQTIIAVEKKQMTAANNEIEEKYTANKKEKMNQENVNKTSWKSPFEKERDWWEKNKLLMEVRLSRKKH